MSPKVKKALLSLLEITLCLAAFYCLLWAWFGFSYAVSLPELEPYLAPERLEERQGIWSLIGTASTVGALLAGGTEIALHLHRRKQRRKSDEHQTTDNQ